MLVGEDESHCLYINKYLELFSDTFYSERGMTLVGIGKKMRSHQAFPFSNHSFLNAVETFAVNGIFWLSWLTVGAG